jgi:hypothetical protein
MIKQTGPGAVGQLAKIVNKAPPGTSFTLPSVPPTSTGGSLLFFKIDAPGTWTTIGLPSERWLALGPGGSKGYRYVGAGTAADPCRSVIVKKKVVRAVCKGPTSTDSPSPYTIPIGPEGAGWELRIGPDRYCAESSAATGAVFKKNGGSPPRFKAIKAGAPSDCPVPERACGPLGAACEVGNDCCEGLPCSGGICGCDDVGEPCNDSDQCCSGICMDGLCVADGACLTDIDTDLGAKCSPSIPCCTGFHCAANLCWAETDVVCVVPGATCDFFNDACCWNLSCSFEDGICQ